MTRSNVELLLAEGREQYRSLLAEAADLLKNLDTLSPAAMAEAMQRRQKIVDLVQSFDKQLRETTAQGGKALAEFWTFRDETIKRILEVDGLVIALAQEKLNALKASISSHAKSKSASQAYEKRASASKRPWLNNMV
jgi:hypothetical protein